MMRNYADLPYLHARIHAMRSRLFSLRDYGLMIREQDSLPGNVAGSKNLTEAKETLFRQQITPVINLAYAYEDYAPFFIANLRQYETNNAKLLLARAAGRQVLEQWYDISPFALLDKRLLKEKLSLEDTKSLLAGIYQDEKFKILNGHRRLTAYLDLRTACALKDSGELLSGSAAGEFREMMIKRFAVLTLLWSNRLRTYYRFHDEKVRLYLAGIHDLYGGKVRYQAGLEQEGLEKYLEQIRKDTGQEPSAADIELHLEQHYYSWLATMFHRDFHTIYGVVAYLRLLFFQIRNLFKIIEGRRFGLSADAILNMMICER
jgi:hypothetical protein